MAQIVWPYNNEKNPLKIDIVSVHLDFSRQSVREQLISGMIKIISTRMNTTVIMGDFNSERLAEVSVIKNWRKTRFVTYVPDSPDYNTYKNKRLDWILISKDMEFVNYQVLPETLSDHAMVIADILLGDD